MKDEIINSSDITKCPTCKADILREGSSLHCWDITYKCGCNVYGALSSSEVYLNIKCPLKNK